MEINLREDPLKKTYFEKLTPEKEWLKAIISDFTSTHIGLLLAIQKVGKFSCRNSIKNSLRDIRAKGLLAHNKDTLADSDTVWVTDLGNEVVDTLTGAIKQEN